MSATIAYTAAACALAQSIYYDRIAAFGLVDQPWPDLEPNEKARYVTRATELLESLRPTTTTDYFELAARLARANAMGR